MDILKLWTICASNQIVLVKEQMDQLQRFADELRYWNEKVNMISRQDIDNIFERHILHSLSILKYIDIPDKAKCLDIGTGGGLPGLPLKIARPEIDMLMIDSIGKKIKVVEMFAKHTELRKVNAMKVRAEDLATDKNMNQYFGFIFSRAVARITMLISWSKPMLKPGGKYIFLKGGDLNDEIIEAKSDFKSLSIQEIDIDILGYDWFKIEGKKLLICTFDK